jgi:amino acid transporter
MSNEFDTTDNIGTPVSTSARPVRVGTVVWGFTLLGLAAMFFVFAQFDLSGSNAAVILTWVILGVGALAVVGGIVGALVRRRH